MIYPRPRTNLPEDRIAAVVVDTALELHRALGPGLLESVYQAIVSRELRARGLMVRTEVPLPVRWKDLVLDASSTKAQATLFPNPTCSRAIVGNRLQK